MAKLIALLVAATGRTIAICISLSALICTAVPTLVISPEITVTIIGVDAPWLESLAAFSFKFTFLAWYVFVYLLR